jgi:hypothetical protein
MKTIKTIKTFSHNGENIYILHFSEYELADDNIRFSLPRKVVKRLLNLKIFENENDDSMILETADFYLVGDNLHIIVNDTQLHEILKQFT